MSITHLNDYFDFDITEAARAWAQDPASNFGVILKANSQVQVRYDFATSEHLTTDIHPKLRIIYSVRYATPTPPPRLPLRRNRPSRPSIPTRPCRL